MTRLDAFVEAAKQRVRRGDLALQGDALPSNGSLVDAIASHPAPVIAELKPRSPSEGRLLDRDPTLVLDDYRTGGAAAISCLADPDFFDGSPELVRQAHATGLPVLWKDFVVAPQQIAAAAHHGASGVLLIERILEPAERETLVVAAHAAGLEVLLELFSESDWQTAKESRADLIGVNARDLETLQVDPDAARKLLARVAQTRPVVALSGIATRSERRAAMCAGASAVLVGTALMTAADPRLALRAMQRPLAKTCGLQTMDDVDAAAHAGADMVGFVVGAPESPRNLSPVAAQTLSDAAKANGMRTVLVTPHLDDWEVREWCRVVKPDCVQLHGLEATPEWFHSLGAIPTIPIRCVAPNQPIPDGPFILDASQGKGTTHAWPTGAGESKRHLSLVAGGLNGSNVAQAIATTGAWGADASSSLESAPGRKDPSKIQSFVEACHGA